VSASPPVRVGLTALNALAFARTAWDRAALYLPIILMGVLALGTYWLVRSTPIFTPPEAPRPATHEPDYFMKQFSVKTFDATGRLKSEVSGTEAKHFPDTDTLEIDGARIRSFDTKGRLTTVTANRALTNADASEVQLMGNALAVREAVLGANATPRMEFKGEFLHAFMKTEQIKSDKPVALTRGTDRFVADAMEYDNLKQVIELRGRVKGTLVPSPEPGTSK
jgi:lipopolysaccharide export system protein LptC